MSRRHFSQSSEISHLIADIRHMTPQEVMDIHGIELLVGGEVYDTAEDKTYNSVLEWAQSIVDDGSQYDDLDDKYDDYEDEDR